MKWKLAILCYCIFSNVHVVFSDLDFYGVTGICQKYKRLNTFSTECAPLVLDTYLSCLGYETQKYRNLYSDCIRRHIENDVDLSFCLLYLLNGYERDISSVKSAVNRNSNLTDLCYPYNAVVKKVELWERPLVSKSSRRRRFVGDYRLSHSGLVVKTEDGNKFFIEKGKGRNGRPSTRVSQINYMESKWDRKRCGIPRYSATVGDFWERGLPHATYSVLSANCRMAVRHMWRLVYETWC